MEDQNVQNKENKNNPIGQIQIDTVYNVDCIELMREMERQGVVADFLLTDIPYGVVNRNGNGLRNLDKNLADNVLFDLNEFLVYTDKVVKGSFVIFCGTEQVSEIRRFYSEKGYTTRLLIWQKTNPSPMNGEYVYLSGIECAIYAKKKGATYNAFCKNTVFTHPTATRDIHDTPKPLSLWYELLRDNTNEGDLVLDTCMGSFTTAVACHKLNRRYIGAEIDEAYYRLGSERLKKEQEQLSLFDSE